MTSIDGKETLTAQQVRLCVTGYDHNRPDPFPGLGDFIGWAGGLERMPNGDILLAHSAGYWHASFASPRKFEPELRERYIARGWPVDFPAPTGGRTMVCRSTDNGQTWSKPTTVTSLPIDDTPHTLFTCRDDTVLCLVNVQASWYGFTEAPPEFAHEIDGLNTKQCILQSTDSGQSWSEPIWLDSPGAFYERAHSNMIQLPDGGILLPTYCCNAGEELFGAIHRSDDSGKTWQTISVIRRANNKSIDEQAIAQLSDGRLIMVTRPDGAVLYSTDDGVSWHESGVQAAPQGVLKATQLFVLPDETLVMVATLGNLRVWISRDNGRTWTKDIPLDSSCYGYPGGFLMDDESIMISYCQDGKAPNRVYIIRFRINQARDDIELLPIVEPTEAPHPATPAEEYSEDHDIDAI